MKYTLLVQTTLIPMGYKWKSGYQGCPKPYTHSVTIDGQFTECLSDKEYITWLEGRREYLKGKDLILENPNTLDLINGVFLVKYQNYLIDIMTSQLLPGNANYTRYNDYAFTMDQITTAVTVEDMAKLFWKYKLKLYSELGEDDYEEKYGKILVTKTIIKTDTDTPYINTLYE